MISPPESSQSEDNPERKGIFQHFKESRWMNDKSNEDPKHAVVDEQRYIKPTNYPRRFTEMLNEEKLAAVRNDEKDLISNLPSERQLVSNNAEEINFMPASGNFWNSVTPDADDSMDLNDDDGQHQCLGSSTAENKMETIYEHNINRIIEENADQQGSIAAQDSKDKDKQQNVTGFRLPWDNRRKQSNDDDHVLNSNKVNDAKSNKNIFEFLWERKNGNIETLVAAGHNNSAVQSGGKNAVVNEQMLEETISTPPIPIDIESELKSPSYKTSKKSFSSACSKNLNKKRSSPKIQVLFISLCSISVFSIFLYSLLYFSGFPLPALEGANLYNNLYFTKSKKYLTIFALNNLKDVSMVRNIETDLPFFWLIPCAADISIINVFGLCYNLSQASYYKERMEFANAPLHIVQNEGINLVNVDLFSARGIDRAIKGGLANSNLANVIISPHLHLMSSAFTKKHQGRLFVLLWNPIERLLEKYFTSFRTEPNLGTIRNFTKNSLENNWLTRQLSNQHHMPSSPLTSEHLETAKHILKHKFLIGKVDNMHESFERYKIYFNWKTDSYLCDDQIIINALSKLQNHIKDLNVQELNMIHNSNSFDMQLYSYAEYLFQQQGSQFFGINKF